MVVNHATGPGSDPGPALAFAEAVQRSEHQLDAVYFRGHGVSCAGHPEWARLADNGTELMLCPAALHQHAAQPVSPFREAGLVEWCQRIADGDRVATF